MKKLILAICLVVGTSIGAGIIALPMVLCKIGLVPTLLLISLLWVFMYYSGLLGIELNLRAPKSQTLGQLGKYYSGKVASQVGALSLMFLIYALLCAYLYGGASIFQRVLEMQLGTSYSIKGIVAVYALTLSGLLTLSVHKILQINRALLVILLVSFALLIGMLFAKADLSALPLTSPIAFKISTWTVVLPVLLTAFGFQLIMYTLTDFCERDRSMLKRAVFWGSLIPAIVYVLWTVGSLGVLYRYAPEAYTLLLDGHLEVGQFIEALGKTMTFPGIEIFVSALSLIAIIKSSLGVGLGLMGVWKEKFGGNPKLSLVLTIAPPLFICLFVEALFIKALSFAGMVSVVITVFLPLWLIHCPKAKRASTIYPWVNHKITQGLFFLLGAVVILSEGLNLAGVFVPDA